jgi:GNAT superfamily N-acetyltransferase
VSLDDDRVAALRGFYRVAAETASDGRLVELGDVQASVVPSSRLASIPNGVVYSSTSALVEALPRLPEVYGDLPYLIWLRPDDDEAARACAAAGLKPDGRPAYMGASLDEIEPPRGTVEAEPVDWAAASDVNERAYGLPAGAFAGIFGASSASPPARLYGTRVDGEWASVVLTVDAGTHLGFYLVATPPEFQRRGLAAELMRVAAADARSRGLKTTALEASAAGEPVYAGLGYRRLGVIRQYEGRL